MFKNALFTIIPIITIVIGLSSFGSRWDNTPNPIARVEIVEDEIEIIFIRPPTEEEIKKEKTLNK